MVAVGGGVEVYGLGRQRYAGGRVRCGWRGRETSLSLLTDSGTCILYLDHLAPLSLYTRPPRCSCSLALYVCNTQSHLPKLRGNFLYYLQLSPFPLLRSQTPLLYSFPSLIPLVSPNSLPQSLLFQTLPPSLAPYASFIPLRSFPFLF